MQNYCSQPDLFGNLICAKSLDIAMPKDQVLKSCFASENDPIDRVVQMFQEGTLEQFECSIAVRDLGYQSSASLLSYTTGSNP